VLFSKGSVPATQQKYDLGGSYYTVDGTKRTFQMLCADTTLRGRATKACVTHLRADDKEARTAQGAQVAWRVNNWTKVKPVVVMGDFNELPGDTVPGLVYGHSGGTGQFQETDEADTAYRTGWSSGAVRGRSGEPTFMERSKIDYVFLSAKHFRSVSGDVNSRNPAPISEHGLYMGKAAWQ